MKVYIVTKTPCDDDGWSRGDTSTTNRSLLDDSPHQSFYCSRGRYLPSESLHWYAA